MRISGRTSKLPKSKAAGFALAQRKTNKKTSTAAASKVAKTLRNQSSAKRIAEIAAIPDEAIDYSDIPELGEEFFKNAKRKIFRPSIGSNATISKKEKTMGKNTEKTGKRAASKAARVLKSKTETKSAKSAAGSALAQRKTNKETSAAAASKAAKTLQNPKSTKTAKSAAASALTQRRNR